MPESVYDRLPLHIACLNNASFEVIELLLSYYVYGARKQDNEGRLPLHYALSNMASTEVIEALINAFPEGATTADIRGWYPIHVACY
eukprot:CAMPEP_0172514370 /NCGR_PEP_ID=MMETSP1066-20121228/259637_1 /TAXON_ID=671091 /ORGANISM="Coscinodiscus wailesii, Strain CCMP2513" /LENGTH=86 /DNA_ID=CAMNT_0013295009 /DNA_START=212 /DNA_END=469 /DNA_ORIENTATION=-